MTRVRPVVSCPTTFARPVDWRIAASRSGSPELSLSTQHDERHVLERAEQLAVRAAPAAWSPCASRTCLRHRRAGATGCPRSRPGRPGPPSAASMMSPVDRLGPELAQGVARRHRAALWPSMDGQPQIADRAVRPDVVAIGRTVGSMRRRSTTTSRTSWPGVLMPRVTVVPSGPADGLRIVTHGSPSTLTIRSRGWRPASSAPLPWNTYRMRGPSPVSSAVACPPAPRRPRSPPPPGAGSR